MKKSEQLKCKIQSLKAQLKTAYLEYEKETGIVLYLKQVPLSKHDLSNFEERKRLIDKNIIGILAQNSENKS